MVRTFYGYWILNFVLIYDIFKKYFMQSSYSMHLVALLAIHNVNTMNTKRYCYAMIKDDGPCKRLQTMKSIILMGIALSYQCNWTKANSPGALFTNKD